LARHAIKTVMLILPDFEGGGAQRVLVTVANAVDRTRFKPSMMVLHERGPWREMVAGDVRVTSLGHARLRHGLWALRTAMRRAAPDIVISTIGYINLGVLLGRSRTSRVIVRESNTPGAAPRGPLARAFQRFAYALLYRRADCVVSPSLPIAEELARDYYVPRSLIRVVHNPVDEQALREAAAPPLRRPGAGRRFVAIGRLSRQKGYDNLIDVLASGADDFHVTVFGDGEDRATLEGQVRARGLAAHITFAGFDPNPAPWVAGADALVLPSRWEGMPNVVLESLACGTPVIATPESGGIDEIARLTKAGAVTIAPIGSDFLAAMRAAPENRSGHLRESLLPNEFQAASVVATYESLMRPLV
jgi:glycosyltransferase involved in cell wall biosynthesis